MEFSKMVKYNFIWMFSSMFSMTKQSKILSVRNNTFLFFCFLKIKNTRDLQVTNVLSFVVNIIPNTSC